MPAIRTTLFALAMAVAMPAAAQAQSDGSCTTPLKPAESIAGTHGAPPYPVLSQQLGEEGDTLLNVTIDETGASRDVSVAAGSGSQELDSAAVDFVTRTFRWKPAQQNCRPMAVRTQLMIAWRLTDGDNTPPPFAEITLGPADYPPDAKAKQQEGSLTISCLLSTAGSPSDVRVLRTSGIAALDEKTLQIVKARYKWNTAQMDGKPVVSLVVLRVYWTLHPETP